MRGHIVKRSTWTFVLDRGLQPLQRCPVCRKRYWTKQKRLERCPQCQGPLEDHTQRRQEFHAGYKSKREAEEELVRALAALHSGTYVEPTKPLVAEYLLKQWLPAIASTIRPTTFLSYEGHVHRHLVPALGRLPLQQLSPARLNALYQRLLSPNGQRALFPLAVRRIHATLHRALRDAVRWNQLPRNPADGADPPRNAQEHEMKVWSVMELKKFLAAQRGSRLYPLWLTLATTGMRRGEVLGLRWEDVDLAAPTISIRQTRVMFGYEPLTSTPKTRRGKRLLALDPATTSALRDSSRRQEEELLEAGPAGNHTGYLFTRPDGEPYHPEKVSTLFRKAARKAGLPPIRLHDLRHTYATLALAGSSSQDCLRAPGTCHYRHHPIHLQSLPARPFGGGRLPGGRPCSCGLARRPGSVALPAVGGERRAQPFLTIWHTVALQTGHVPLRAGRPLARVTGAGSLGSRKSRHLRQRIWLSLCRSPRRNGFRRW